MVLLKALVKDIRLSVVGYGKIGQAAITGFKKAGIPEDNIMIHSEGVLSGEKQVIGGRYPIAASLEEALDYGEATLFAVKKDRLLQRIDQIAPVMLQQENKYKIWLSTITGLPFEFFLNHVGSNVPVSLGMMNTPVSISEGMTVWSHINTEPVQRQLAKLLWGILGCEHEVSSENADLITKATGGPGSGPAYFYRMTRYLKEGIKAQGFSDEAAELMARQTFIGAGALLKQSGLLLEELEAQVATPGGATAQALDLLERAGCEQIMKDVVAASSNHAAKMGQWEDKSRKSLLKESMFSNTPEDVEAAPESQVAFKQ